jgi:hypothetical protein
MARAPEELPKARNGLRHQRLERFRRDVASRDARAAGGNHDLDLGIIPQPCEQPADLLELVTDQLAFDHAMTGGRERFYHQGPTGIRLERARIAHGDDGDRERQESWF